MSPHRTRSVAQCGVYRAEGRGAGKLDTVHILIPLALAIALVALSGLRGGLCLRATVGGEGAADIVALLELPARAAADEPLVRPCVDQLALGRCFTRRHAVLLLVSCAAS